MAVHYIFTNILGSFVFDDKCQFIENAESAGILLHKYPYAKKPDSEEVRLILEYFKDKRFFLGFYEKNIEITTHKLKESVTKDVLVIQTINVIDDITKVINMLTTSLREWYELHNPEFSRAITENEKFVKDIMHKRKKELLQEIHVDESIGTDLPQEDIDPMKKLAEQIHELYTHKKIQEQYLEGLMNVICPNMTTITGALLGAKLMALAGSLKHLSQIPASTVQLLGAEKALFRHMTTGAKCPKYGILFQHPYVSQAKKQEQGKIARLLADKISIAVKVDYFKGAFIGDTLKEQLKEKI